MFVTFVASGGTAVSQDFSLSVADANPLGIGSFVPSRLQLLESDGGIESGIKGTFLAELKADTIYDSNFFLSETDEESELSFNVLPVLTYSSDPEGGATWTLNAVYQPAYRAFVENSDLNNFDQTGDLQLAFKGARTAATIFTRYGQLSATDRLTGNFSTVSVFSSGLQATRQIAPRTSLNGGVTYSKSEFDTDDESGAGVWSSYFGGLWDATERTSIGSSISYSRSESDDAGTGVREAWALLGEVRYKLGERIWLSASLGPEFSSFSDSGSGSDETNVSLQGEITSRYTINERWSWVTSFITANIPSPSDTGYFVNDYGFSTSLEHQMLRALIVAGFEYNYTQYEAVGLITTPRDNEKALALYLTYSRGLFNDRISAYSTVRYATNSGVTDWSQWQLLLGFNMPF
jgi:hypothetical protein